MEPKAKTIAARFGFQDPELKTPRHDEIMMWLDENLESVLGGMNIWVKSATDGSILDVECYREGAAIFWPGVDLGDPPDTGIVRVSSKVWEFPVQDGRYIVGFIDMAVKASKSCGIPYVFGICREFGKWRRTNWEDKNPPKWSTEQLFREVMLEVKPSISSLGEVIRQINMYRTYKPGKYAIVSPDDRFKEQLISQGIDFVKCP